jgi:hypothetical protein
MKWAKTELKMKVSIREIDLSELEQRIAAFIAKGHSYLIRRLILITVDDRTKRVNRGTIQEAVSFVQRFLWDAKISQDVFRTSLYDEFGRDLNLFLLQGYQLSVLRTELENRRLTDFVKVYDLTPRWYRLWRDNGSRIWPLFELPRQVVKGSRIGLTSGVALMNSRTRLEYGELHSDEVLLPKVVVNCTFGAYTDVGMRGISGVRGMRVLSENGNRWQ